jgi:hypothetical protein
LREAAVGLEAVEGEDIPDDFVEQFRMSNFRTPEELALQ